MTKTFVLVKIVFSLDHPKIMFCSSATFSKLSDISANNAELAGFQSLMTKNEQFSSYTFFSLGNPQICSALL